MILGVPVAAEPPPAATRTVPALFTAVGWVGVGVFGVAFEVGAGGVEEQQVDLEVEQVRHGEEHRLLHVRVGVGFDEQVHRPVGLILIHAVQTGDGHVVRGPVGGGELRGRVDGPVRDECEQHPFDVGGKPAPAQDRAQRGVDVEGLPQPVQQPCRPGRARGDQSQPVGGGVGAGHRSRVGAGVGVGLTEVTVDRAHQPPQAVGVEPVLPAQVEQHVRLRRRPVALVVGQGEVAHDRAVLVRPRGRPQVHDRTRPHPGLLTQASTRRNVCPHFWELQRSCDPLTRHNLGRTPLMCPPTAERGVDPRPRWCHRPRPARRLSRRRGAAPGGRCPAALGLGRGAFGESGQLAGDPSHRGLSLVAALCGAPLRPDCPGLRPSRATASRTRVRPNRTRFPSSRSAATSRAPATPSSPAACWYPSRTPCPRRPVHTVPPRPRTNVGSHARHQEPPRPLTRI